MKRLSVIAITAILLCVHANAQEKNSPWTLNTQAWCTNYFTTAIGAVAESLVKEIFISGDNKDSLMWERILPDPALVFPIGLQKGGFNDGNNIYGPYHYAFGNPFKHIGDYAVGIDASWKDRQFIGFYAGAYFKSQEIVWKEIHDNIRGFYFQPRAGIILGGKPSSSFEAGVFYDVVTGCHADGESVDKSLLKSGLGLDFAFSSMNKKGNSAFILQFSMPLHNFFDKFYNSQNEEIKRKVGYIMLTKRIVL